MTRGVESSTGSVGRVLCGGLLSSVIVDTDAASLTLRSSQTGLALLLRAGAAKESYKLSEIHDGIINLRSGKPRYAHLATWLARQPEFEALSQNPQPSLPVTKPVGITNSKGAPLVEIVDVSSDGKPLYRLDFAAETAKVAPEKVSEVASDGVKKIRILPKRVGKALDNGTVTVVIDWETVEEDEKEVQEGVSTPIQVWAAKLDEARTGCALNWMLWNEMKATYGTDTDGGLRRMWCETYLGNLRASEESLKMLALHIRQQEKLPRHKREERPEEYEYDLEMLYTLVGNFRDLFYGVIPVREWAKIRKHDHKQLVSLENAIRPALAQRH